jgi:tRNA-Thr(GGU) m(6)t(6)A37 methyltransferase TsaA
MNEHAKHDFIEEMTFKPIGIIHSEHKSNHAIPIQPVFACGCRGIAELLPEFEKGLKDIDGFSHLHLLYYMHKADAPALIVKPYLGDQLRGIFATRSPKRPNPIGLSVVRLIRRDGCRLYLDDVDILDGTPLLDIKPFVARFDHRMNSRNGWLGPFTDELANL